MDAEGATRPAREEERERARASARTYDDEDAPSSEGEGENLMKESGNIVGSDDDSSEEEDDDDEEEQRRIAEGFIVDDDGAEDEEEKIRRRKRRRQRRREEEAEELDEDDLALLKENRGPEPSAKRFRPDEARGSDLAHIFDDDDAPRRDAYDDDGLDDFIEEDDEEQEFEGLDEEQREAARRERLEERRRARQTGARVDPLRAGIDPEAWDEVHDIFGNGEDYAWALEEDEAEEDEERLDYRDIFEPAQIQERLLTDADERIRQADVPERLQLSLPGEDGLRLLERKLTDSELDDAARWAAPRISERTSSLFDNDGAEHARLRPEWLRCVRDMLAYLLNDMLEVPFLTQHRMDELEYSQVNETSRARDTVPLLVRQELVTLSALGLKYKLLLARKEALRRVFGLLESDADTASYFDELLGLAGSNEEVADVAEWLSMRFGDKYRDAALRAEGEEPSARQLKKPQVVGEYERVRDTSAAALAARFGLSAQALAANVSGARVHVPDDDASPPADVARELNTSLTQARTLLSHEIGREPLLRKEARALFRSSALLDVEPTERGMSRIDEGHPYYNFKFLRSKPVSAVLQNASQFLQIVHAEEERLVSVTLRLPTDVASRFERRLVENYQSDGVSDVSRLWNEERGLVVEDATTLFLIPHARAWAREWLLEECRDSLLRFCEAQLTNRVEAGPYQSAGMQSRNGDPEIDEITSVPRVLAVSHGVGDPRKSAVAVVFLDDYGRLLEHTSFDSLRSPAHNDDGEAPDPRRDFIALIRRRRPDVVVVNGFSARTVELRREVEDLVRTAHDERVADEGLSAQQASHAVVDVISCYDDVARLYQHSQRAASEFAELSVLGRYCVGLARYVQSPVNEFAALGDDLVAIQFDPAQRLLPADRLRSHLERAIVLLVNDIGVDLNAAVAQPYAQHMLQYVAGLGPRKALALVRAIAAKLEGHVASREALVRHGLLTFCVWTNCVAFLRIEPSETETMDEEAHDVLDETRIHPEDYDYPRQMARDALSKHEEDLEGEHPSLACREIMEDAHPEEKLAALDLDSYAAMLYSQRGLRKRLTLYQCKQELIRPFDDWRPSQRLPGIEEQFTMFTGESRRTLAEGFVVPVTVLRVEEGRDMEGFLRVRLDAGLDGTISGRDIMAGYNSRDVRLRNMFRYGQTLSAVVVMLDMRSFRVELSIRPEAFEHTNPAQGRVPVDPMYFDNEQAQVANEQAEARLRRRTQSRIGSRVIDHPNYFNFNSSQAESYLATQPRGAVVVRPSSRGMDHLAVTWKVDDGVYQHIDVLELDKENDQALGRILRVADMGSYSDLDDLIVNHVRPMAMMVEMMMNHEKYKGADTETLHRFLTNTSLANPTRSIYAFGLNKQRPGYFDLAFKANSSAPIQTWPVKVLPGAFRLGQASHLSDMAALTNAFKTQYAAQASAAAGRSGARTPGGAYRGAATPMHGGMTPGRYGYGAATPGAYGGATPGRFAGGYGGGTTPGAAYGAPPPGYGGAGGGATTPGAAYGARTPGGAYGAPPPGYGQPPPSRPGQW
ncbi:Transcription elongation factor spt6 [Malassezia cuniculi]|uniref:Transcription elongation factor SPT6 n=1 Tax=Malassezia cuniculi TaxID=948313 RepID=A0AAF0EUZ1_9BASI|nr:Transcription elongation factor spt6 [Malassezia cuniculi]